jgi:hypothetical protein
LESEFRNKSLKLTDREKVKVNKKLLIYLFFLIISIALWYLNALSKDYSTFIDYNVRYENFPKGKALIKELPEKLSFKVKGLGFSILKHKLLAYTTSITLPIDNFRLDISRKDNQYIYFLLTRYTKDWISSQLGTDIQLVEIQPDTLIFNFTDVIEKKVAVRPALTLQFEKQYMQNGHISVRPDSVIVSGPQVMIDTITGIYTKDIKTRNLKDTLKQELELNPFKRITCNTSKVSVMVPVEKFTELSLSIPIETSNAPDGLKIRTFPSSVSVSCIVGLSAYDKMSPYMFRAVVDYNNLIVNHPSKVKVDLVKSPLNAQNIRFYPKSVEYIIEK